MLFCPITPTLHDIMSKCSPGLNSHGDASRTHGATSPIGWDIHPAPSRGSARSHSKNGSDGSNRIYVSYLCLLNRCRRICHLFGQSVCRFPREYAIASHRRKSLSPRNLLIVVSCFCTCSSGYASGYGTPSSTSVLGSKQRCAKTYHYGNLGTYSSSSPS